VNGRKPKNYSILEVLNFSDVGLIFEFYSTKETGFISKELGSLTGKNIILVNESNFRVPTFMNAILLKEYDAKRPRYRLILSPQNYHSVIPLIDVITQWINENCETTFDTQMKVSLSFDHRHLNTLTDISHMNPIKLILKFDENEVYKRFPEQKDSPYALSIKKLSPIYNYINESYLTKNINNILSTPYAEFYGINFKEYTNGILEMNYIGGKNYSSQSKEIKDLIEYFIIKTYQSINNINEYDEFEKFEIKRLTESLDKYQMAYYDPDIFVKEFPNIKIYVDLKMSDQILKTYWNTLRQPLFEMIVNGELRKGQFNYDTQYSRFQLRKAQLKNIILNNMDLVSCELSGIMENCVFLGCNVKKARVYNSHFLKTNIINESYLNKVTIKSNNIINNCFIENTEELIGCDVNNSVIKFATIGKSAKIDESSTIITKEEELPQISGALKVDEIRDYTWIKNMRKQNTTEFANEYKRNKYFK